MQQQNSKTQSDAYGYISGYYLTKLGTGRARGARQAKTEAIKVFCGVVFLILLATQLPMLSKTMIMNDKFTHVN